MRYLRSFVGLVVVFGGSALVCWWVVHAYGYLLEMTSNADSLAVIDFSRDLFRGEPLGGWNLPRAPFLFPDALIASFVLFFGWSNNFTIITIASINYSLLIISCYTVLQGAYRLNRISLPGVGLVVTLSLLAIMYLFPVSVFNVYWQIFASGTHFGTVVVIALMLSLNKILFKDSSILLRVFFLFFLTVAAVASNVMALLLLMFWLASEVFSAAWKRPKGRIDMLVVFFSSIIGVGLSSMIPRQSMAESFFSIDQFIRGIHSFREWFYGSFDNAAFIFSLIFSSVAFPLLMQGRWPKFRENTGQMFLGKDFVLPSLGVIAVSPMFFQAAGSLRYLIFPAFILILCFVLIYFRLIGFVENNRRRPAIFFAWSLLICSGLFFSYDKVKTASAYESNAAKSYQCIKRASLEYPLQDGIASYWNARPVRFYSNFEYYLAQVTPWRPSEGHFFWGNNGYSFLYKNTSTKLPRQYNYILATNDEVQSSLWGGVINKAINKVSCEKDTLFYFDDPKTLWDFLFSRGLPTGLEPSKLKTGPVGACAANFSSPSCIFAGGDAKLSTQVGVREGGVIKANGQPGFLVFGPYIPLESGVYRLVAKGSLSGPSKALGVIDVVADLGKRILVVKPIVAGQSASGEIVSLDFEIMQPITDAEFRINIPAQTVGSFIAYDLNKIGEIE